jgi:ubiquinone/menaquinone biosynthesis C-methylase UbiE
MGLKTSRASASDSQLTHDYERLAKEYSQLGLDGTYYLAYRDVPHLIKQYCKGNTALDFGCGAGRSTRLLRDNGMKVIGVDESRYMLDEAHRLDPRGKYQIIQNNQLPFEASRFDLVLSSIVFMEISTKRTMVEILREMRRVLKRRGIVLIVTHSEEMYNREWASFKWVRPRGTKLKSGTRVEVTVKGTNIKFFDYYWKNRDYLKVFPQAGLKLVRMHTPLAREDEPFNWISETDFPPWMIYVLRK